MDAGEYAKVGSAFERRLERVSGGYLRGVDGFGERSLRFAGRTGGVRRYTRKQQRNEDFVGGFKAASPSLALFGAPEGAPFQIKVRP